MQPTTPSKPKPKLPPLQIVNTVNKIRSGFTKLNQKMVPAPVALLEMVSAIWVSQSIGVAAKLGIADHIQGAGTVVDEIARKVNVKAEGIYRLLRALSVVGIVNELQGKVFQLTSIGECLKTDHPQSMRHLAIFQTQTNWQHWEHLEYCIKTGSDAVTKVRKEPFFEFLRKNETVAEHFDKAMVNISKIEVDSIVGVYDFSKYKTIADVGGGYGAFLGAILQTYPRTRGILFDLPHVVEGAKTFLRELKVFDRVEIESGSFFDSAPAEADCYMMKHIIHDWSDEKSLKILKNIRGKISDSGKLLLFETVIPEAGVADFSKFLDLEMLVVTEGGKERTKEEFTELLAKAKFKIDRIVPTISMVKVIEASPV